ncbi:calcium-binding protein [Sphingomonas sp. ac-8]|uniref:calcium-binding protein n=1 Tax=Sphingomonas sp. ac-8 TaxID=3242977 RepID=UPI003A81102C
MAYYNGTPGKSTLVGSDEDDVMSGHAGSDRLNGGYGNDILRGGSGDDNLAGGHGNDYLQGDSGRDILFGGSGNDILVGGYDADRFVFDDFQYTDGTVDVIKDFKRYEGDTLELKNGVTITGAEFATLPDSFFENGDRQDVRLTLTSQSGDTQTVWLADVISNLPGNSQTTEFNALENYLESLGYTGGIAQAA